MIVRLAALLALLLVSVPSAWADKGSDQAARQLEFAQDELNAGDYDRAIKSAESALRLDPTAYTAIVIKALAYEAQGDTDKAEALFVAYLEFTKGIQPDPRVAEGLARLRAGASKRRTPRGGRTDATAPDAAEHAAAMQALITAGRCDEALVPSRDAIAADPKSAAAYEVLGDVQRCAQRMRGAALAYRKAVDLGGTNPALLAQLEQAEARLSTLVVTLRAPTSAVAEIVVLLRDLEVLPTGFDQGVAHFDLMPPGTTLELQVGGRGFQPQTIAVPGLEAGELRHVEVSPTWLGVGTVTVARWSGGIDTVEIIEGDQATLVRGGDTLQVGAGRAVARMTNSAGVVELPLTIARSRDVALEPGRWIPSGLVIHGLPTGATVEIALGRSELTIAHEVPRGDGTLDATTGALIAGPQTVRGLAAGAVTLRVKHPGLGAGAQAVSLAPGQTNEVTFDQAQMPGTAALVARWKDHDARPAKATVNVPALGAAIGGGVALVLGGVFAGLSADSVAKQRTVYDSYVLTTGTGADAVDLFNEYQLQRSTTQDRGTAAGVLGAIGVLGVGVAIPLGLLVKPKARARASDWAPEGF